MGKLHEAAVNGDIVAINELLGKIDVNETDGDGISPLFSAIAGGHVNAVKLLVKKGADVNKKSVSVMPTHGWLMAARQGWYEFSVEQRWRQPTLAASVLRFASLARPALLEEHREDSRER